MPNPIPSEMVQTNCCRLIADGFEWDWRAASGGIIPVVPSSPRRMRYAVQTFAHYFKWNYGYDFLQYEAEEKSSHKNDFCLLFTTEKWNCRNYPIGAACLRWRKFKDETESYGLAWAWMHPFHRGSRFGRASLFAEAWPLIRKAVGRQFIIEPPISADMTGFLKKMGEEFDPAYGERSIVLKDKTPTDPAGA